MSLHWWHVAISYVLVLGGFGALALEAAARHARAKRMLAALETRPRRASDGRRAEWPGAPDRVPQP